MLFPAPASEERLVELTAVIEEWLADQVAENPAVQGVERIEGERHWYVRLRGEQKETFGVVLELGQRTLRYDTYLMPAPQERAGELYEHLLRRNLKLYGCQVAIGAGTRSTWSVSSTSGRSMGPSSTGCSAPSTWRPSSSSGPRCASATRLSSREGAPS
jgi:hypothetical protein